MELNSPPLMNGRRVVRALAVLVFACGLSLSAARVVGTRFEPLFFIPAGLAVLLGWLMSRMHIVARVLGQVAGFVASGIAVAYASGGTTGSFLRGLLDGPHQVITTAWPSPRFPTIFVALSALIYLVTAISIDLAMRVRWRALCIVPMIVGMVALIAVGAPDGPQMQALVLAGASSFVLLWIGLDDRVASIRSGLMVGVSAGLVALLVSLGVGVAVAERANPRTRDPADSQLALLDPLADVTSQQDASPPVDLYDVESPSLPTMKLWRLSALDVYNGEAWSTSGRLLPVGNRLDIGTGAEQADVHVTAKRQDTDLWVSPGRILRSTSPVEADGRRRVIRIIGDERPTSTVFTVEPLGEFDTATAGAVPTVQPTDIESSYKTLATGMAGNGTVAQQVSNLAAALHSGVYILNPATPGGVQQTLIDSFLRSTQVGNVEQFVTGFVLLARSLGVDARVATGYEINPGSTSATITTKDAAAWAEVRVTDGWVRVNVVPDEPTAQEPQEQPAGQPETPPAAQPDNPPQVDQADTNDPVDAPLPPAKNDGWSGVRVWVLRGGLFAGLLLWPVFLFALVVTWKKIRRRKGLKADDPARRVSTAWTLATDALVDAGATLQTSDTNAQLVEAGVKTQPAAGPPLGRLQRHADAVTFATASVDPKRAADAVDQLKLVEASIRNSSSRWWRWKWWLSTRSLRRRTQSPLR
ncbi:MAG TPA: transglutaminase domain-containing protein [Ilumatobacteraceae bacterium]|nr:transglutaminase domain-containing protein [Ilumatobacteraceae bacterium]